MEDLEFEMEEYEFEQIPEGTYEAEFKGTQLIETMYGKSLKWIFDAEYEDEETGEIKIVTVSGLTRPRFTEKSKAYRWYRALGGTIDADGKIRPNKLVGKRCLIHVVVRQNKDGIPFSNVDDVLPLPKSKKKNSSSKKSSKKNKKTEDVEQPEVEEYDMTEG